MVTGEIHFLQQKLLFQAIGQKLGTARWLFQALDGSSDRGLKKTLFHVYIPAAELFIGLFENAVDLGRESGWCLKLRFPAYDK